MPDNDPQEYAFSFRLVLDEDADGSAISEAVKARLTEMEEVEDADVFDRTARFMSASPEWVLQASVLVIEHGPTIAEGVTKLVGLIQTFEWLRSRLKGVTTVQLEVGGELRELGTLTEADLEQAAEAALD